MKFRLTTIVLFCLTSSLLAAAPAAPAPAPQVAAPAPQVAAPAPDVAVSPVVAPLQISDARGKFVALHFLLKTECPFCLKYTHEYASRAAEAAGVVHVFLKPDEPAETLEWMAKIAPSEAGEPQPVIYHDPGARLAEQFKIPGGYKFHGQVVHYPALVLLDPSGAEGFRYVGKANTDRCPFDTFAAKVAELSAKDPAPPAGENDVVIESLSRARVKGRDDFASRYRGNVYRFVSRQTRALFAADPEKYLKP